MIGVIIVTHGRFGEELMKTAEMMLGPVQYTESVALKGDDTIEDFQSSVDAAIQKIGAEHDILILADLFGGTPGNIAAIRVEQDKLHVVTGVNLPMLIEVLNSREDCTLQELSNLAGEAGKNGIQRITKIAG